MLTEKIRDNLYRIGVTLPRNPLKLLNSYLITGGERPLLIDTGFRIPECKQDLLDGLNALGIDRNDLDILVTHFHSDHLGLAPDIIGPNGKIYINETEVGLVNSPESHDEIWRSARIRFLEFGMSPELLDEIDKVNPAKNYSPDPNCKAYVTIKDGDIIEAGPYKLKAISVPGHTPGNMVFWVEDQKIMFTGDHVLFDITPNITSWPQLEDALGSYIEGLKMVQEYPVELALPGHRETGDFHARVDAILKHHEARLAESNRIVHENPGLSTYDVTGLMTWAIRTKNWDTFPPTQKYFAVGECQSHLDYLMRRGMVRREKVDGVYRYYGC